MKRKCVLAVCGIALAGGLGAAQPEQAPAFELKEVFPGVRVDLKNKVVEFDGTVPVDAHTKSGLKVFLETAVCGYDSKEHESLVVTKAKPSQVHAGLLLIGLKAGKPGAWKQEEKPKTGWIGVPPEGDEIEVRFVVTEADGTVREEDPASWIVNIKDGRTLAEIGPEAKWVFAGSKLVPKNTPAREPGNAGAGVRKPAAEGKEEKGEVYLADIEGTLVGLTSFGSETIGWTAMYNPDSDKEAPEWIARKEKTPEIGGKVIVRIRAKKPVD